MNYCNYKRNYLDSETLAKTRVIMSIPSPQIIKTVARWCSFDIGAKAMASIPNASYINPTNDKVFKFKFINKTLHLTNKKANNLSTI